MSWTDIYPVFDEDMLESYRNQVSEQEKAMVAELFEVEKIYRRAAEPQSPQRDAEILFQVLRASSATLCGLCGEQSKRAKHIVATSLFWKPASPGGLDFPVPSGDVMRNPGKQRLSSRFENPWEHSVAPVFEAARHLAEIRPDLVYRVYSKRHQPVE